MWEVRDVDKDHISIIDDSGKVIALALVDKTDPSVRTLMREVKYVGYNGWTNRETYLIYTSIANIFEISKKMQEIAETCDSVQLFAQRLESYWTGLRNTRYLTYTMTQVLFDVGSLYRVNWLEVAQVLSYVR